MRIALLMDSALVPCNIADDDHRDVVSAPIVIPIERARTQTCVLQGEAGITCQVPMRAEAVSMQDHECVSRKRKREFLHFT